MLLQASDRAAKVRACLTGYPRGVCKPGQDLNFPPKDGPAGKPEDVPRGPPEDVPVGKPEDVPWMGKPDDVPRGGGVMPDDLPLGRGQGTPNELPAKGNRLP